MPGAGTRAPPLHIKDHDHTSCPYPQHCFLCLMKEPVLAKRNAAVSRFFKNLPSHPHGQAFSISAVWSTAMASPNDPALVELGVFECMASLIWKGIQNRRWLFKEHDIFIPYYAAHIIGSFTMNRGDFAEKAVAQGVVPPLLELLCGRLTWVEQRVAARALGHMASFENTFEAVAAHHHVLQLAMELAVSSLEIVYVHFIQSEERRLKYHRDLLARGTRGAVGLEMEARKGEEWASQLQCWSLQLINCFAMREEYVPVVCRPSFLAKLPGMWGGLTNENSPAGMGLLLTICRHKVGRSSVADCPRVIQALCNTARSSDDWQYMAVDCLLLLLQDVHTRRQILDEAIVPLADLAVQPCRGERKKVGRVIVEILLHREIQSPVRTHASSHTKYLLEELASQVQRGKWEKAMHKDDLRVKQQAAHVVKLEGNTLFSAGDIVGALYKYSEALSLCPLRATKERVVLYSNRAQCHLLLQHPEAAISDTTRALCLYKPLNGHGRSLWRRAQGYEMLGLSKESLLDAIMFINECANAGGVPDYAERLVRKQIKATWLFLEAARRHGDMQEMPEDYSETKDEYEGEEKGEDSEWETASESDMTFAGDTTDQGSYSVDENDSDHPTEKDKLDNNCQKLWPSFNGMDFTKLAVEESSLGPGDKEKDRQKLCLEKELLKKRIYKIMQEKHLFKSQKEIQKPASKES